MPKLYLTCRHPWLQSWAHKSLTSWPEFLSHRSVPISVAITASFFIAVKCVQFEGTLEAPIPVDTLTRPADSRPLGSVLDAADIQELNLFGQLMPELKAIDPDKLRDTTLALQLVGIIGYKNSTTARSLIAEAGKPAQMYFQGDALPGGAELVRIDRQFVIVRQGELLEKLQFTGSASAAKSPARRRNITESLTEAPAQPVAVETIDPKNPAAVYGGLRERLAAIRRAQHEP